MKIYTYELEKKPRMNTNGHECRIRGVESQKVKKSKGEIRKCVDEMMRGGRALARK